MTTPTTPADEALAREILKNKMLASSYDPAPAGWTDEDARKVNEEVVAVIAELIAAHVAAQAPSGSFEEALTEWKDRMDSLPLGHECSARGASSYNWMSYAYLFFSNAFKAHKAQPVADVRGMVEVLDEVAKHLRMDDDVISALRVIDAALASARHTMGGEVK